MTSLWLILLIKSTVVLLAAAGIVKAMRTGSAAARHLVWSSGVILLLLLPLGLLLPESLTIAPSSTIVTSAIASSTERIAARVSVPMILSGLWALGALLLLVRLFFSWCKVQRLLRHAAPPEWLDGCRVRFTPEVPGPLAWSFGGGTILLPLEAGKWNRLTLSAALRHEAAHLARRDCQILLLAEIARCIYWLHPLMWYALRRLRIEQEYAADDAAVQSGMYATDYARQLVELARSGRSELLLAGAGTYGLLTTRVKTILNEKRNQQMQTRRMILTSAATVLTAALPLIALQTDDKVYRISDEGVTPPVVLSKLEPDYTPEAKEAKIEGAVLLSAIIETNGRFSSIGVLRGLDTGLDQNAITALGNWEMKPAEKDGVPVRVSCKIEINFKLL